MKYGFYFRFYKFIKNELICSILSEIAYFLWICKFQISRLTRKKQIIKLEHEQALEIIRTAYADPCGMPDYKESKEDPSIDLSIIIPVYNYANLIEKNVDSVLNQKTSFHFEVILVDDGSTDGAGEVLQKYKDNPCVTLIYQKNQGIAGARNTGLNYARGKYIMFVDCDDIVDNNLVELLMTKAISGNHDIVMCGHNLVKETGGIVTDIIPNVYPSFSLYHLNKKAVVFDYAGLPWAKVYKRKLFKNVRFFPKYWYEDSIIQVLLFSQCKSFAYIPEIGYQYKWYENNFSHTQDKSTNPKSIDRYWLLLRMLEQYKKLNAPYDEAFYIMLLRHVSKYYYPQIAKLDPSLVEALFSAACDEVRKYKPRKKVKLPYMLKLTEKAMLTGDINLWKLAIYYQ